MSVVFWDFDGTLVYSLSLWSGSVHRALTQVSPDTSVSYWDIKKHMAYGFTWHTPHNDYSAATGDKWWDLMNSHIEYSYRQCGVSECTSKAAAALVRSIIKLPENYHLFNDTLSTLSRVKELGYHNVLLSNNYPDLQDILDPIGLSPLLDGVIVSAVEGYDKPRQELFDIAKTRFASDRYYMVGDSVTADIHGGKQAGMTTILVHHGYHRDADYCTDDLHSILSILLSNT